MVGLVRRSRLLVPMSEGDSILRAGTCGSDAVVLELCELVPETAKPMARLGVRDAIDPLNQAGAEVFVQVDRGLLYADIKASVWPGSSCHQPGGLRTSEGGRETGACTRSDRPCCPSA